MKRSDRPAPARVRRLEAKYQKLMVLSRVSNLITSTRKPATLLRRILREAVLAMKATSGSIYYIDQESGALHAQVVYGIELRRARQLGLRLGRGVTGKVAMTGKPLRVDDVRLSPDYVELKPDVRSELAVPLIIDGETIGVLNVDSTRVAAFKPEDERLLVALAAYASKLIQTARLYEGLNQQTRKLETLFDVGQALISPAPLPVVLNRITRAVLDLMDIKLCSLMLLNEKRELVLSAVSGGSEDYSQRPNLNLATSLVGRVVTERQPLQVFDVRKAPRYRSRRMARREHLASLLSVPITFYDTLIGILNIYTARPRRFTDEEMRLLNAFASLCGIAIENSQRYQRVLVAEESIRQSDRLATLGILSAEIAHEIRNPTTIISMLLHTLREDRGVAPGREKDIDIILEHIDRINRIVSQVLSFSKQRETRLERVDINQTIEDLLFLVNHNLNARTITVKRQLDSDLPRIMGDRGHFDQILLNLMLNAAEVMAGGGVLTIKTSKPKTDRQWVHVVIKDTGPGIPPEILPQLFTPFVTARKEGIGLGLFISQKLLNQYGGRITVKTAPGKGTAFTVQIPVEHT